MPPGGSGHDCCFRHETTQAKLERTRDQTHDSSAMTAAVTRNVSPSLPMRVGRQDAVPGAFLAAKETTGRGSPHASSDPSDSFWSIDQEDGVPTAPAAPKVSALGCIARLRKRHASRHDVHVCGASNSQRRAHDLTAIDAVGKDHLVLLSCLIMFLLDRRQKALAFSHPRM